MNQLTFSWAGIEQQALAFDGASTAAIDVSTLPTEALSGGELELLRSWLSDEERSRAERFLHGEDRRDFVAAHALLRMRLRDRFPDLPFPAFIAASEQGAKPRLSPTGNCDGGTVDFNISHTRGMAACVIAKDHDVGIDCEPLARKVDVALAEACFSQLECEWLETQRSLTPSGAFLHLWTLKEAVTKALGIGLAIDLKAFTVLPFPPRIVETSPEIGVQRRWSLWQWPSKNGFILAVAARKRSGRRDG